MKTIAVLFCVALLAGGSACGDQAASRAPEGPQALQGEEREPHGQEGPRRGPPDEAYKACEGKGAGSEASFTDPRGETLEGTCEEDNGKMVLRPHRNKGDRQGPPRDESGS